MAGHIRQNLGCSDLARENCIMWKQAENGLVDLEINHSFLKNKPIQLLEYFGC